MIAFVWIVGWWLTLRPTQDANWEPVVARLPHAAIQGDHITVYDVRNFDYRSADDFTPQYDTEMFDLTNLRGLDLFINYWGSPYMAHPIISFDFGLQGRLCFSIEIRPKVGQPYSPTVSGSNPNYPELANHKNVSLPQSTIHVAVEDRYLEGECRS